MEYLRPNRLERAPTVTGRPADRSSGTLSPDKARILELQRTLGNDVVSRLLVQRAPVPGLQGKAAARATAGAGTVQRLSTGGRGLAGLVLNRGAAEREQQLSERFRVIIGPHPDRPGRHFSHSMLDRMEAVLEGLGQDHVRRITELRSIRPAGPGEGGSASLFDPSTRAVDMVAPLGMPSWLYTVLNRGSGWQRWLMDRAPLLGYDGVGILQALGVSGPKRRIMGGTSKVLAHGNLVTWTVRHEIGHAVDQTVGWAKLMGQERFGGWREHTLTSSLAREVLDGIVGTYDARVVAELAPVLTKAKVGKPGKPKELRQLFADAGVPRDKLEPLVAFVQVAARQPWTFNDGGGEAVVIGNRVYQVDYFGEWVSYLRDERANHAVSNYQFSSPGEWFAEAYAAFKDPGSEKPRDRLNPNAVAWFATDLPRLLSGREVAPAHGHPRT
jgi:hypothetical protein